MQNATDVEVQKVGTVAGPLPCDSLLQDFLGFENIKLSSKQPRGVVLFAEGQPADGVYVLCAGRAKVSISSSEGKTVILRIAQPGDLLGVNSVLKGLPYEATVQAIEPCRIDFVSRSDFIKLLDKSKTARVVVSQALGNELSDVVERARSLLLSQSATEKLARLLLKWCDEQGAVESEEVRVNPGLTHEEIAQMICASRETVTRLFAELRRKHILSFANNAIFVRDRNALESLVCYRETSEISSG
jgi:CRP/FNR family transcriptional regulator, cyclic AMP receptor protein